MDTTETTQGTLTTRVMAMHGNTNPSGDIFGGWVLSQMDIAAGICAGQRSQSRVVTVSLESMSFIRPVKVGDILGVYTRIIQIGNTSMTINVEAWVRRDRIGNREKVTEGNFKFVALDDDGKPKTIPAESELPSYVLEKNTTHEPTRQTMNIVLYESQNTAALWIDQLTNLLPNASISQYSVQSMEVADYFICANPPTNLLTNTYNIKAVFLLSAGFDYYSALKKTQACKLLDDIPCYRLEDAGMSEQMMDYVTYSTLKFFRRFDQYDMHKTWSPLTPYSKTDFTIGIMGTGELGSKVAERLAALGFTVNTWNRSEKRTINVTPFIGASELDSFIHATHLLINLLPLNKQTEGILNKHLFENLAKPSYLINTARGGHVVEDDLIEALQSGILSGAQIDVTKIEPLLDENPLFSQQNCFITPHVAAETLLKESCDQISQKIKQLELNKNVSGRIDWTEQFLQAYHYLYTNQNYKQKA